MFELPKEMKGSGTPVSGASPITANRLSTAWQSTIEVIPAATSAPRAVAGELRGSQAGVGDQPVEADDAEDPERAELLADDRQDHVRVGLGQVEDLLHRLPQADAEQPAGPDRDHGLDGLEAGVRGVGPGVEERGQPLAPVGLDHAATKREAR